MNLNLKLKLCVALTLIRAFGFRFLEHSKTTHALGRVGTPEEVAKAIVYLGSNDLSGFMTGVTLPIDGGRGIMCPR